MKQKYWIWLFCGALALCSFGNISCSRKSGCPAYEHATTQTNKKGQLSNKRGKSSLFPKNMKGHKR